MTDETTRLREEVERLRATNTRLNRRCSTYEAGLKEKLEDAKRASGSLGRMLANAAAAMLEEENARLREVLAIVWSKAGPRGHHLGCECGGHNGDGVSCKVMMNMIRAALQSVTNTNPPAGADGGER